MEAGRRASWTRPILFGCVGMLGLACVLAAILVAMNWSRISEFGRGIVSELRESGTIQKVLREKYKTSSIRVQASRSTSVPGVTLCIEFTNAPFFQGLDFAGPNAKEKALEIAITARDALPAGSSHERYQVTFVRSESLGLKVTRMQRFFFAAGELPPPTPR